MKDIKGNLFDYPVIVIPTNGVVKANGRLVMGAGVALEARNRFKDLDALLGHKVSDYGSSVYAVYYPNQTVISFPTKHHYRNNSDLTLIETSTESLVDVVTDLDIKEVYLPKVGCGKGNLQWSEVKTVLDKYLDDRFILVL